MLTRGLMLRIAGPTLFVSLLFLGTCLTATLYLHHWQPVSVRVLDEALASRRIAGELQKALDDLAALTVDRGDEAGVLNRRIRGLLAQARQGVDELERFNAAEIERSEAIPHRMVTWVTWGLAGVGIVGSVAGLLMGYGVARGLGRSVLRAEELAEVGQIAAGMAHELRNPLTSIKMLVQIDREKTEARGLPADDLHAIEQEIRRMEGRLNAFMDFARPPRPERRRLELTAVVDQTLTLVRGRAAKQRVALRFDRPSSPILAEADGEQLRQLLVNLALNALDVMPRGGILQIELDPPADGQIELRVLDAGPGIPMRHLPRLYEPFFTSKETGLGLGLVVSQRIARDHGGSLQARNRAEGGACFVLRLPAAHDHRCGANP